MSRYSYAGNFKNPADNLLVKQVGDKFYVFVREDREVDPGEDNPWGSKTEIVERPHTMHTRGAPDGELIGGYDEAGDAGEEIDHIAESFEEDYSDYLEENRYEIAQMERYEQWRNEY